MNRTTIAMVAAVGVLSLAACRQSVLPAEGEGPAVTARPEGAPTASVAIAPAARISNGHSQLVVEPGHVFACEGRDRAVATIAWSSSDPAVKSVTIKVQGLDDPAPKVFTVGGATGTAETGNWMVAGVRITMADSGSGRELATHAVKAYPCQ